MSVGPDIAGAAPIAERPFGPSSSLQRRTRTSWPIHRYSRFVAWMKLALPTAAVALLLLVAVWPRIQSAVERLHKLPRIDLSQARDLRMVNLHYSGKDRHDRPFTVTADAARQRPEVDDLVELEGPKADMTTQNDTWLALTAYSGVYRPQSQLLDLFGNVELFQDKGNEFKTDSAHIDMAKGSADGADPIEGHGSFGTIEAEGFRIENQGDIIIFTGKARLLLEPHEAKEQP
ncbi:MAG TPA: LPS export ABC transporter periplasmic protein LptC [Stellaceae bacterium]|jgi:lipopolysaccharide export system protein LptC|nr:LPS export ABC transporter periplasmic protein LptC [Stellaceae bacterium]